MEAFGGSENVSEILMGDMSRMVFIVEDDPNIRELYNEALDVEGVMGLSFGSSDEALATLSGQTPRALITDVDGLGHMDGLVLAQKLRERRPDLPVLVVSGGGHGPTAQKLDLQYLAKPARLAELIDRIMMLLSADQLAAA